MSWFHNSIPSDRNIPVILLAGATASGKSQLAMTWAARMKGVIINADALQSYNCLQVLTAQPPLQAMEHVAHFLYSGLSPVQRYSVGSYLKDVEKLLPNIRKPAVFVGGSGLYFEALLNGLNTAGDVPQEVVTGLEEELKQNGLEGLYIQLQELDPKAAVEIKPGDKHRILRALGVVKATGQPLSAHYQSPAILQGYNVYRLVLDPPRNWLYQRINSRFDDMLADKRFFDELQEFINRDIPDDNPVAKAIGVRHLRDAILGKIPLARAVELAKRDTRRYAKRQMTWFRNRMSDWERVNPFDHQALAAKTDELLGWIRSVNNDEC